MELIQRKLIPEAEQLFVLFSVNEVKYLLIDVNNDVSDVFWMIDEIVDPTEVQTIGVCSSDDFIHQAINLDELNESLQTIDWQNAIITE